MRRPPISGKKLIAILKKLGFKEVRQRGSHVRMEKITPEMNYKITIPLHKELKKKTLSKILQAAEISIEEFSEFI